MTARYAIKLELADNSLEPFVEDTNKASALRRARRIAADYGRHPTDVVAVWVDDNKTELGVQRFPVIKVLEAA